MPRRQALSPHQADVRSKEAQSIELRIAGLTFDEIARTVGYANPAAARKAVLRGMERRTADTIPQMREIELSRLDNWTRRTVQILVKEGQDDEIRLKAVDRLVRLAERRARLCGLDAAEKYEMTGADGGPIEAEITVVGRVIERVAHLRQLKEGNAE